MGPENVGEGAPTRIPSKSHGKRCASDNPCCPPEEHPEKYDFAGAELKKLSTMAFPARAATCAARIPKSNWPWMSLYAQSALVAPALAPAIALAPELANMRCAYPRPSESENSSLAYLSAALTRLPPQNPPHPSSRNLPFQFEAGIASKMPMRGWTYP